MKINSRYSDLEDVNFKECDLPNNIRELYPWVKNWCLNDPEEIQILIEAESCENIEKFRQAFLLHQDEVDLYVQNGLELTPVPDSVVIVDLAYQAYDVLISMK